MSPFRLRYLWFFLEATCHHLIKLKKNIEVTWTFSNNEINCTIFPSVDLQEMTSLKLLQVKTKFTPSLQVWKAIVVNFSTPILPNISGWSIHRLRSNGLCRGVITLHLLCVFANFLFEVCFEKMVNSLEVYSNLRKWRRNFRYILDKICAQVS